jgi:hypothetical protein
LGDPVWFELVGVLVVPDPLLLRVDGQRHFEQNLGSSAVGLGIVRVPPYLR